MTAIGALLTAIGIAAAVIARVGVARAARGGGVAGHLARLLTLIALLLALRLAGFALPSPVVTALTMAVAAWLPLMTLRLAEELVRRHAPRAVKLLALGGAGAFTFLAVTFGLVWTGPALIALALFQAAVIAAILFHLLRQRASVSLAERRAADMLALAFGLALPLLATDFAWAFPGLPFRGGPFAALVFVLACSRLAGRASRPLRLLGDLALAVGAGGLAALSAQLAAAPAALTIALAATAGAAKRGERANGGRQAQGGGHRSGLRHAPGGDGGVALEEPGGRQVGRGPDDRVRRLAVPHQDLGRGP